MNFSEESLKNQSISSEGLAEQPYGFIGIKVFIKCAKGFRIKKIRVKRCAGPVVTTIFHPEINNRRAAWICNSGEG